MQTEQELLAGLLAGLLAVENGAGEAVKIEQPQEKNHEFAANHHGMMSGSSIGLIIIEPASDAEIKSAQEKVDTLGFLLSDKGLSPESTESEVKSARAATLFKDYGVAARALEKLQSQNFSQTALSYLDEIVSQRRRVFNPERPRAFKGNAATEWGNGKELEAIAAYEELTGLKLEKTGDKQEFVRLGYVESVDFDFSEWFGCTPDSVTMAHRPFGEHWGFADIPREFKNPASGVVFDRYRKMKTPADLKKENPLYYWQCIAQMACLDAPYMQWIAHDCDIKSDNPADKFVIIDFERDMAVERVLIDSLFKAAQYIKNELNN